MNQHDIDWPILYNNIADRMCILSWYCACTVNWCVRHYILYAYCSYMSFFEYYYRDIELKHVRRACVVYVINLLH